MVTIMKLMKIIFAIIAVFVATVALAYFLFLKPETAPDSQVFINANVLTMDENNTTHQAIALNKGKIVAVGSNQDVESFIGDNTVVHDVKGKTIIPGFVDAHSHFPGVGLGTVSVDINSPPIGEMRSIDDIKSKLKQAASKKKPGKWVIGYGYDDSLLVEQRHVTRDDLDEVSTEHPIYLMHISGHFGVANSLGLELSGIDENIKDIEGGVYVRDKSGRLNGVMEETARIKTAELAFDLSFFEFLDMIKGGVKNYASEGVTTVQSGLASETLIKGLSFGKKLGFLLQTLVLWPEQKTGLRWAEGEFDSRQYEGLGTHIGAVKLVVDGSIQGYTGFLNKPYYKMSHGHKDDYRGYPSMSQEKLNQMVLELHQKGLQIATHVNGDAAIDAFIEAVEKAQAKAPRKDARHIAIHAQMATEAQLKQMQKLGIVPSFFVSHVYYWGDRHRDVFLGPERAASISPTASSAKLGQRFALHLDTPVVPMQPLHAAWVAVNRQTSSGKTLGANERISPMQALRALTIDAAWQLFLEGKLGSLEVGKQADLVVLDKNPVTNGQSIKDIQVLKTFVNGVEVFTKQ